MMCTGGITGYWLHEVDLPVGVFVQGPDGYWWQCIAHWGPVLRTNILVAD